MANRKIFWSILGLSLVFGLTLTGCKNDSGDSGGASETVNPLNGSWVIGTGADQQTLKLDNGNFEISEGGALMIKGIYTNSASSITMNMTNVHGGYLIDQFGEYAPAGLERKWYSKSDLKTALGISEDEFNQSIEPTFREITGNYSVNGNTLTVTSSGGETNTYTRS